MKTYIKKIYLYLNKAFHNIIFIHGIEYRSDYTVYGIVKSRIAGSIKIGSCLKIISCNWANPIGSASHTNIIVKKGAILQIGNRVGISNSSIFVTDSVSIGNDVMIGAGCRIWDTNHHSLCFYDRVARPEIKPPSSPVVLKDGCWLGGEVTVLPGVTVGERSVVAFGAVVSKDIPDGELWGGVPARKIRSLQ